ncbi:PBP1A family penicillin-binding protein [Virgibacillus sp. 179-BFC.A HS]|uniref:PBP1A family penicillin-binding protein n=1 Tax=Tigheibacillus jepli TaxID=3035914 RepID=A0ABU5CH92_9BACI|nr:PBP1A family penicillin-binding protein [Virgibacillus sp. 179-BFC.A HS]MDY0405727.1 PBP1A family penicillin-binding protein [Virgibacillus sp. 179-BFC.A HS]
MANGQTRMGRRKQKQQPTKKKSVWKKILLTILILILALFIGLGGLLTYYIASAPKIDAAQLQDNFSSKVFDMNNKEFADLGSEKRTRIEYEDLPQVLVDAVTATEDSRFFKHHGVDVRRIGAAVVANFKNGFGSQGASTITQQLVEKSFLSPEKQIKLKVQEAWLSLKLERKYSKEQILEMYLNKIYYGSGAWGIGEASKIYFGKSNLKDLTLPEAAILAGLPQRPTAYDPYEHPDLTKERMKTVLQLMVRHHKISQAQADKALKVDIKSLLKGKRPDSTKYEAFLQEVTKEVKEKVDGADVYKDGLKIYTTLDTNAQKHVEFLLKDSAQNPINYPDNEMQAGMTVLDTQTGAIRAIGGRRNSKQMGEFNYALHGYQAGSTAKPLIAYGPAIEYEKWSTYHQINDDKPYQIKGTDKSIGNWNGSYQGWMSIRNALANSLNVPAVKTLEEVGFNKAKTFAEGLGIKFAKDQIQLTDAIGGSQTQISPLQMAGAYSAFGNGGVYNQPYAVTKVEFPNGRTVNLKPEPKAAMSDYTAYMITDMLKTVVQSGTGTRANVPGVPIAGKTGTTNLPEKDGSPDSWFTGYSTKYTVSVWTGGYEDENGKRDVMPDTKISLDLFRETMQELSKNTDTPDFQKPDSVVSVAVEKGSNPAALPSKYTPSSNIVQELFVKGHEPSKTSEKYDKLDPVSALKAEYDKDKKAIKVNWDYDDTDDVSFEVSASIDGGAMKTLSTTGDTAMEISSVEPGSKYEIQVVAISDDSGRSDAKTTSITVPGDEDEEIPPVTGLNAKYRDGIIDVNWNYNGPDAVFEVSVNGQNQTVQSNGIEISGANPGQTYTITVVPVGKEGDKKGPENSTSIEIPNEEPSSGNGNQDNNGNGNSHDHENEDGNDNNNDNGGDHHNDNGNGNDANNPDQGDNGDSGEENE